MPLSNNFTSNFVSSLPYARDSKNILEYQDTNPKSRVSNCTLKLIVGVKRKTYYLIHRKYQDGKSATRKIKLGNAESHLLTDIRDIYLDTANKLNQGDFVTIETKRSRETFEELVDFYLSRKPNIVEEDKKTMLRIKDYIGHTKLKNIDRAFVLRFLERYKTPASKKYHKELIQRVWNFSKNENSQLTKLLYSLEPPTSFTINHTKQPSDKLLERHEFQKYLDLTELANNQDKKDLLKLFFYLGQHPYSEICKMRWDQIKPDTTIEGNPMFWWMEKGFHKNKKQTHTVYLHPKVMEIIERHRGQDDTYVFVNMNTKDANGNLLPYTDNSFRKDIAKMLPHFENFEIRALRATQITNLATANIVDYEAIGGHITKSTTQRVYVRGWNEKRLELMNAWMQIIDDILSMKC